VHKNNQNFATHLKLIIFETVFYDIFNNFI